MKFEDAFKKIPSIKTKVILKWLVHALVFAQLFSPKLHGLDHQFASILCKMFIASGYKS